MSEHADSELAIATRDLGIFYNLAISRPRTIKSVAGEVARGRLRKTFFRPHWAIRHASIEVLRHETLGIVGVNGSGKSTLLLALAGVIPPDEGWVQMHGHPTLLTLGAGFQIELTGRQNIFLNAAYLGLSRRQTEGLLDAIVDFSGLEGFIDVPLRQYSTGMRARLGFAVATHLDPDILLVDEALSVGDSSFQQKSRAKMLELMERSGAIVVVSHDPGFIGSICSRVVWINGGRVEAVGDAADVLAQYQQSLEETKLAAVQEA